jgi:hypothetical protein
MSWLRNNSIRYQGKIRFVNAGSIGLRPVLQQAGLNATLNNFQSFPLRPWATETAVAFIKEISLENKLVLEDGVPERMTELLGTCIPHYVRMFFENVYRSAKSEDSGPVSAARVEEIYNTEMLGVHGRAELSHYEERLRLLGPEFYEVAVEFLSEAAIAGQISRATAEGLAAEHPVEGKTPAVQSREVLGILEHDGYLKETSTDVYLFESKLTCDWWKKSYEKGFKCLKERGQ